MSAKWGPPRWPEEYGPMPPMEVLAGRDDLPPTELPVPVIHEHVLITGDRRQLLLKPTVRIDSFTKIEIGQRTWIGDHVHIASFCHLGVGGGSLIIQAGATLSSGVQLITGASVTGYKRSGSAAHPDFKALRGALTIGFNATLFAGCKVLPGCHIGNNAVIGVGAVVTKPVPAYQVWVGNPARFLRWVDGYPVNPHEEFRNPGGPRE